MATPDYTALDAEILAQISQQNRYFAGLLACLELSAKAFCLSAKDEPFRVIDRRLQALKQKGKIGFDGKNGWRLRGPDGGFIGTNL